MFHGSSIDTLQARGLKPVNMVQPCVIQAACGRSVCLPRRPCLVSLRGTSLGRPFQANRCPNLKQIRAAADFGAGDDDEEQEGTNRRRRRGGKDRPRGERPPKEERDDGFKERVVQVSRVTKVVKGGKQLSFRAVVVVGDEKGQVGVGVGSAKEVVTAVVSAAKDAKKNLIKIPVTRNFSFPHRIDGEAGAAKVMLRPASEGTGVIAGGSVRVVLEMAGVKNAFGKQLGSGNPLNNARATIDGLSRMRTLEQVAELRDITVAELLGMRKEEPQVQPVAA
eukprot:jgi/Botrbrau1/4200/Bobra.0044s0005.1